MWIVYDTCEGLLYNGGDEHEAIQVYNKMRKDIADLDAEESGEAGDTLVLAKVIKDCTLESTGKTNFLGQELFAWKDYDYQK